LSQTLLLRSCPNRFQPPPANATIAGSLRVLHHEPQIRNVSNARKRDLDLVSACRGLAQCRACVRVRRRRKIDRVNRGCINDKRQRAGVRSIVTPLQVKLGDRLVDDRVCVDVVRSIGRCFDVTDVRVRLDVCQAKRGASRRGVGIVDQRRTEGRDAEIGLCLSGGSVDPVRVVAES
jgi:hypothetical protein